MTMTMMTVALHGNVQHARSKINPSTGYVPSAVLPPWLYPPHPLPNRGEVLPVVTLLPLVVVWVVVVAALVVVVHYMIPIYLILDIMAPPRKTYLIPR